MKDPCFIPFSDEISARDFDLKLNDPFGGPTPEICRRAAEELQDFIEKNQDKWDHNFGFDMEDSRSIKGKMFGVLVVKDQLNQLGYLCAYSGKLGDTNPDPHFVPSLFDITVNDNFLSIGMKELSQIGEEISNLESKKFDSNSLSIMDRVDELKQLRKSKSTQLQNQLFEQYQFVNYNGESKSLNDVFEKYAQRKPAAGSGDCAAPKLLQYAHKNGLKPLAIAEFWWGKSTHSQDKKHKQFYPACEDKCRPILEYMLGDK